MKITSVSVLLGVSVLLLQSAVSQHASGVEVEVHEGVESVLLPCHVPADVSRDSTAVWDRGEFKVPTIHVRDPSGDDLVDQNDRYKDRTSMRADALQTGDLSLTLRNPTGSDSGTYTCTTRRLGQGLGRTEVQLKVKAPPPPVVRLFCHLLVFSPYCISTGLLLSICSSRKTPNRAAVSMEMTQRDGGGQGFDEEYDDVTADVITEHAF